MRWQIFYVEAWPSNGSWDRQEQMAASDMFNPHSAIVSNEEGYP